MLTSEILLYNNISPYSASDFITSMQSAAGNDVCVRVNGDGGDVEYGWGMIAKFKEHAGNKLIKVDGRANSMYAFMLCYSDDSEALDVSSFILHRAAYPDWFENDPDLFTEEMKADVNRVNKFLQTAFEAKVDVEKFEALAGMKMKQFFALGQRAEVMLTAADAKKIGLVNRVVKITPAKTAEIKRLTSAMAAKYNQPPIAAKDISNKNKSQKKIKMPKMNLSAFKAKYPKTFAAAVKKGADEEYDRISACLVYNELDSKGVTAAIESRKPVTQKMMAEFSLAALNGKKLEEAAGDSAKDVTTGKAKEDSKTDDQKRLEGISAAVNKKMNLK